MRGRGGGCGGTALGLLCCARRRGTCGWRWAAVRHRVRALRAGWAGLAHTHTHTHTHHPIRTHTADGSVRMLDASHGGLALMLRPHSSGGVRALQHVRRGAADIVVRCVCVLGRGGWGPLPHPHRPTPPSAPSVPPLPPTMLARSRAQRRQRQHRRRVCGTERCRHRGVAGGRHSATGWRSKRRRLQSG